MNKVKQIIKNIVFFRFLNSVYNFFRFKISKVPYPNSIKINGRLYISNKGKIILGNNIRINSGKNFNVIGGDTRTNIIVAKGGIFSLGKNVALSNSSFYCANSIVIEEDVLIGGNCKFYDTDFHALDYTARTNPYKKGIPDNSVKTSTVLIKKGAWIGGHCIVLKGVTIGEKSIIGAGSVVSKNIPDHEIWAGNPIKFVRKI